jgi:hypothetical protein
VRVTDYVPGEVGFATAAFFSSKVGFLLQYNKFFATKSPVRPTFLFCFFGTKYFFCYNTAKAGHFTVKREIL